MKRGRQGKNYKLQNIFIDDCDKVSLWHGCYRRTVVISPGKRPASDVERWETAVFLGQTDNCCIEGVFFLTDSSSQLATWEIILIITGVVLFIILVILVIFLVSIHKSITEQYFVINHLLALHSQGVLYQLPEENYGVPVQKKWYPHLEACNTCETLLVQMLWDQIPFSHS